MKKVSRRGFVGASLAGATLPTRVWTQGSDPVPEDYRQVALRPEIRKVVEASRQVILDELKPNRSQLERGLELHYSSYVTDVCGCLYVADPSWIWKGDRLAADLKSYRGKLEQEGLAPEEIDQREPSNRLSIPNGETIFGIYIVCLAWTWQSRMWGTSLNPASKLVSSTWHGPGLSTTR